MKQKKQIKPMTDVLMTVALLFLMAYQVTGDKYHEWIGAGMLVLFLLHNFLNLGWYKALWRGKYSAVRILRTVINLSVLAAILVTGYSGIVMSRYVFASLKIPGGMATARRLHLAGSYWAFVLMSVHLGMHWNMLVGKCCKGKRNKPVISRGARVLAGVSAIAGAYFFAKAEIFQNMFLRNEFAMLDYETSGLLMILQNLAMMSTWAFIGHYVIKGVGKISAFAKENMK